MNPVLAQKMGRSPVAQDKEGDVVETPMRVMRRALARAADKSVGLSVSVLGISQDDSSAEDLIESAPQDWVVLGLRDGHEPGLTGLFLLDPVFRSALVEMQTMGNLLNTTQEQRKVTGTDATLTVPFAASLLTELSDAGFGGGDVRIGGYDIGPIADIRTASLVLTQGGYRFWRVTVQLGGTDAQGELMIAMRAEAAAPVPPPQDDKAWSDAFQKSVGNAPAEMDAVLATLRLPISNVETFEVGQVVPLAGTTVGSITLTGPSGERFAQARLGQVAGKRAVRIETAQVEMHDVTHGVAPDMSATVDDTVLIDG